MSDMDKSRSYVNAPLFALAQVQKHLLLQIWGYVSGKLFNNATEDNLINGVT